MSIKKQRRWYEKGLGLRRSAGPAYHLLRFLPGYEGDRAFVEWIRAMRTSQARRTIEQFDCVVASLNSDSIVLDIGANVGDVTERLAATGAQVHAFEPEPILFKRLCKRFENTPNVVLHEAAVAAQEGAVTFWLQDGFDEDPLSCQSHSIVSGSWNSGGGRSIEVQCVDFFDFVKQLGRKPDLVKMDIEGAEVDILERMISESRFGDISALFVETHERQNPSLCRRIKNIHKSIRSEKKPSVNLLWV